MKKKIVAFLLAFCMIFTFAGCGSEPEVGQQSSNEGRYDEPEITVRLATGTQRTMPACAAAELFSKLITERTQGRILVEFYPERQLGEDGELIPAVMNGTLEMAIMNGANLSSYTNMLNCIQLPFLLTDYDKIEKAYKSDEMFALYEATEDECGIKILCGGEYGIRHIGNNVRAINSMSDLKGLKLRVVPSDLIVDAISSIGANPTPLAYSEIYTALQSGVLDGEEINYTSVYSEKHYEVLKYFTNISLWPFPCVLACNDDFFESLSAEDQKLFMDTAEECLEFNMESIKEYEEKARSAMEEAGVVITKIEDLTPFIEATKHLRDEYRKLDQRIAAFIDMAEGL